MSLPLDCAGRLGREVVADAVNALDLGDDALNDLIENSVIDRLDLGCHSIDGVYGADDNGPLEGAGVVAYANGFNVGDKGEVLPYLTAEACDLELLT